MLLRVQLGVSGQGSSGLSAEGSGSMVGEGSENDGMAGERSASGFLLAYGPEHSVYDGRHFFKHIIDFFRSIVLA